MNFKEIPLDQIQVVARQREVLEDENSKINDLATSIKERGLLQPLVIKTLEKDKKYRLIAGERRLSAVKLLEWDKVPCNVFPKATTELELQWKELDENVKRKQLSWQEEDLAIKKIHELMITEKGEGKRGRKLAVGGKEGWSTEKTAELLGKSRGVIDKALKRAEAAETFPEVHRVSTRDEADKKVARLAGGFIEEVKEEKRSEADELLSNALQSTYVLKPFKEMCKKLKGGSIDLIILDQKANASTLEECHRLLGKGWIVVFCKNEVQSLLVMYDILTNLSYKVTEGLGIWSKTTSKGIDNNRLGDNVEFFLIAYPYIDGKDTKIKFNEGGVPQIFDISEVAPEKKSHPEERPIELYMKIIQTLVPQKKVVLFPYLRDGNGILAATNLGNSAFGYGEDEELRNTFLEKLEKGTIGRFLSLDKKK